MIRAKAYALGMLMAVHARLFARAVPMCIAMRAKAYALGMLGTRHHHQGLRRVLHPGRAHIMNHVQASSGSERGGGRAGEGYIAALVSG